MDENTFNQINENENEDKSRRDELTKYREEHKKPWYLW